LKILITNKKSKKMETKGLLLDEKSLQEVSSFLQEMPLKHGLPLLNYLNAKIKEQGINNVREEVKSEE
jgi:hypothetical protein